MNQGAQGAEPEPESGLPEAGAFPGAPSPDPESPALPPVFFSTVRHGFASQADSAAARRLEGELHRRTADKELLDELAAHRFSGWRYRRFEEELAKYGTAVLRGWMSSGHVFALTASRGFHLHPTAAELEELQRDPQAREDLANMTVAYALPRFRDRALMGGGWKPDGGARLSTYFVGACLYEFPNQFRGRRDQAVRWKLQDNCELALSPVEADPAADPAALTAARLSAQAKLCGLDRRTRAVVMLTVEGYRQDEIAEMLGEPSARAVEGVLHRWRARQRKLLQGGDR